MSETGPLDFVNGPLVRVTAPIIEAQLVETSILNQIHFQSIAATKASRVVAAVSGNRKSLPLKLPTFPFSVQMHKTSRGVLDHLPPALTPSVRRA